MKNKILIFIAGIAIAIASWAIGHQNIKQNLKGSLPAIVSATSSAVVVGPQENIRVVASSTSRVYLYMANDSGVAIAYCKADGDNLAVANQGIKLSTSTSNFYEFTSDRGNLYGGSVRCTASASTTIIVTGFNLR